MAMIVLNSKVRAALPPKTYQNPETNRSNFNELRLDSPSAVEGPTTNAAIRDLNETNDPSKKSTSKPERNAIAFEDTPATQSALLQATQEKCEVLRGRVLELQGSLKDAHDFIFSLQTSQQRLTETEAAEEFKILVDSVEELVDRKLGEALGNRTLTREKNLSLEPSKVILNLIAHPGREAFKYPETDEYNITAAILRFLCQQIFDLEFYCPMREMEREFMVSVEHSMRNLEPKRDIRTYRTWRSETYTAIASRHEFSQRCEGRKMALAKHLTRMLHLFAPNTNTRDLLASVHKIIELAFVLAHKMHLSIDQFSIEWSAFHNLYAEQRGAFPGEFADSEFVDLHTNRTLKTPPKAGTTLRYVFDITPRLVFRRVKADSFDEPKVLKRSKILVRVTEEDESPDGYGGEPATVLGWLKERIYPSGR